MTAELWFVTTILPMMVGVCGYLFMRWAIHEDERAAAAEKEMMNGGHSKKSRRAPRPSMQVARQRVVRKVS
jgi:hypothetical protein